MTVITHKNDTIATVETKEIKYQVTIRRLDKSKSITIEKRSKAPGMGMCADRIHLEIPDWEIIKPLVEEALREDEIMQRVLMQYRGMMSK